MGLSNGDFILTVAVLSILFTAPLGAFIIDRTYKKLLTKEEIVIKSDTAGNAAGTIAAEESQTVSDETITPVEEEKINESDIAGNANSIIAIEENQTVSDETIMPADAKDTE